MQTVVIASQKGGSGKTTLSGHLAVEAERAGAGPVALIDTDPQGSLAAWWNARAETQPIVVKVNSMELSLALDELHSAGVRLAVVDTPPAITMAITKVISSADLVIIPTRPSPHDLRAVGATVDIAEHAKKPLVFVLNDATPRARITGEAAVALSQHGTVAPVTLYHRVDYAASMVDGRSVGEVMPQSKSAGEIKMLWEYIADRLSKVRGDSAAAPVVEKKIEPTLQMPHRQDEPAPASARKAEPVLQTAPGDGKRAPTLEERVKAVLQMAPGDGKRTPAPDEESEPIPQLDQVESKLASDPEEKIEPGLQMAPGESQPTPAPTEKVGQVLQTVSGNGKSAPAREAMAEPVWRPTIIYNSNEELRSVEAPPDPPPSQPTEEEPEPISDMTQAEAQEEEAEGLHEEQDAEPVFTGPERRDGLDRRLFREPTATFGSVERRTTNPFGRRRSDRIV